MFADILSFASEFSPFGPARSARLITESDANAVLPALPMEPMHVRCSGARLEATPARGPWSERRNESRVMRPR